MRAIVEHHKIISKLFKNDPHRIPASLESLRLVLSAGDCIMFVQYRVWVDKHFETVRDRKGNLNFRTVGDAKETRPFS